VARLQAGRFGVRIPAVAGDFSPPQNVQTDYGIRQAYYSMDTIGSPACAADHSHLRGAPRLITAGLLLPRLHAAVPTLNCLRSHPCLKTSLQYFQSPSAQVSHRSNPTQTACVSVSPRLLLTGLFNSEHMARSYAEGDSTLRAARRVRLCVDAPGWGGKE